MGELLVSSYLIITLTLLFSYLQVLKFKHKKKLNEIESVGGILFCSSIMSMFWVFVTPVVIIMLFLNLLSENMLMVVW